MAMKAPWLECLVVPEDMDSDAYKQQLKCATPDFQETCACRMPGSVQFAGSIQFAMLGFPDTTLSTNTRCGRLESRCMKRVHLSFAVQSIGMHSAGANLLHSVTSLHSAAHSVTRKHSVTLKQTQSHRQTLTSLLDAAGF